MQKHFNVKYKDPGRQETSGQAGNSSASSTGDWVQPLQGSVSEWRPLWDKQCQSDRDVCLEACGIARIASTWRRDRPQNKALLRSKRQCLISWRLTHSSWRTKKVKIPETEKVLSPWLASLEETGLLECKFSAPSKPEISDYRSQAKLSLLRCFVWPSTHFKIKLVIDSLKFRISHKHGFPASFGKEKELTRWAFSQRQQQAGAGL